MKVRSFNMLDKNAWVDFIMKLDSLQATEIYAKYTPYAPQHADVLQRGFKAFLQVCIHSDPVKNWHWHAKAVTSAFFVSYILPVGFGPK